MELNKTFIDGLWSKEINVTSFVQTNITPYVGDASFLQGPTDRTKHIWNLCLKALEEERANNGVRSLDNKTVSTITSHKAGYIDKEQELIVGLQTDQLLKRAIKPFGGINVVSRACKENGVDVDEKVKDIFTHYRKTHNDGVFDVYTEEIRSFRSLGFLTGLPDNYARGRIIGDYRRLALYGTDRLIEAKTEDLRGLTGPMTDARIRLREEVAEQIKALKEIRTMGEYYGLDLSRPAHSAQEAVQWVYMAYLAAVKEQDGAAMSLGNVSSFLDIFIEYDLAHGNIDEVFAQELIDQFVIKLRMVRHLRMQSYNDIFAGDPTWVTEAIGGRFNDGRTKVTKTSFRFLQTLYNLGPSPEPNLTILWSPDLPQGFKDFCAKVSADTSSIQYENDELMREVRHSDDYGIACCVSYQDIGRQIQFFGARCNLAKALLLALNGGRCENTGTLMVKGIPALTEGPLRFEEVMCNYKMVLTEIARVYNEAMNIIHYMHDKYYYEKAQMALVDTDPRINLAYGVAGLSIALDSLSAI
ncbi:pyruvate formate lyase family protein, partial [Alistipes finegoldii]